MIAALATLVICLAFAGIILMGIGVGMAEEDFEKHDDYE